MTTDTQPTQSPAWMFWTGWVLTVLVALLFLASGGFKFAPATPETKEGLDHIGWQQGMVRYLAVVEIACALIYLFPRTSILGAILLTGYMGGAIATHARIGDLFIFQAIIGVFVWIALWLREPRVRALVPWRT